MRMTVLRRATSMAVRASADEDKVGWSGQPVPRRSATSKTDGGSTGWGNDDDRGRRTSAPRVQRATRRVRCRSTRDRDEPCAVPAGTTARRRHVPPGGVQAWLGSVREHCVCRPPPFRGDSMMPSRTSFVGALLVSWATLCGAADAPGVPRLDHVIVVVMENKNYEQVLKAPYIASLVASASSFSDYHAITHPSQPNYLALWAGSTLGVRDNNCPATGSPITAENLGHACEAAGISWRSYAEDLPSVGSGQCKANG